MTILSKLNSPKLLVAGAVFLLALNVTAVMADDSIYNYVQVHALRSEYANAEKFTLKGFEVRGGFKVGRVFSEFRYRDLTDKPDSRKLDEDRWNVTLGYAFPSRSRTHFDLRLNYGEVNMDGRSPMGNLEVGVDYFGVSAYVHHQLSDKTRLYAGLEQQNWQGWGSTQKAYHLGVERKLAWMSLGAEYTKYSDSDAMSLFARYSF